MPGNANRDGGWDLGRSRTGSDWPNAAGGLTVGWFAAEALRTFDLAPATAETAWAATRTIARGAARMRIVWGRRLRIFQLLRFRRSTESPRWQRTPPSSGVPLRASLASRLNSA